MTAVGDARHLHANALGRLLTRLDENPDRAAERYEALRQTLQQFFLWRNALDPDACADETLDRVARKLDEGAEVDRVRSFVYGVARLVLQEEYRRVASHPAPLTDVAATGVLPVDENREMLASCLDRCLDELSAADRTLVLRYYQSDARARIDGRVALALELGVSAEALRTRVQRIRNRLERCTMRCRAQVADPGEARESVPDDDRRHRRAERGTPGE